MSNKEKKKRRLAKAKKETQTVQLKPVMWDALTDEARKRGISRNQWIKVILSHRHYVIDAEKRGEVDASE